VREREEARREIKMRSFSVVAGGASFFASALSLKGVDGTEPPIYYALTAPFFYFAFAPQRFFHSLTAREKKRLGFRLQISDSL
jgi:hypothetical protein